MQGRIQRLEKEGALCSKKVEDQKKKKGASVGDSAVAVLLAHL